MGVAGTLLLVALGGALGGVLRALVTAALDRPGGMPLGTLFVNATGSAAAGLGAALVLGGAEPGPIWAWLGAGLLGSYTTVSAFALQAHGMGSAGKERLALGYIGLTVALCLLAAALGGGVGMAVAA